MGRGKVELKRIENNINRQVTFSKRRSGLVKKAKEISVLCDAEVGLIVFSNKGKLTDFSSTDSSMKGIIDKYERYSYLEERNRTADYEPKDNWNLEHRKLLARIELLQRNSSNYVGEDLDPLSLRELQSLQHQLDNALKRVQKKKNQLMLESISHLQKKGKSLQHQNNLLAKKLKEEEQIVESIQEEQPASSLSVLNFGENGGQAPTSSSNIHIPSWLLRHPVQ